MPQATLILFVMMCVSAACNGTADDGAAELSAATTQPPGDTSTVSSSPNVSEPLSVDTSNVGTSDSGAGVTAPSDVEGDGVADNIDNCPDVDNPSQTDSDGDGEGDACETTGTTVAPNDDGCLGASSFRMAISLQVLEDPAGVLSESKIIVIPHCRQGTARIMPPSWGVPIGTWAGSAELYLLAADVEDDPNLGLPPQYGTVEVESISTLDGETLVDVVATVTARSDQATAAVAEVLDPKAKAQFSSNVWNRFVTHNSNLTKADVGIAPEGPADGTTTTETVP